MKFKITRLEQLPKLSWLIKINKNETEVELICGSWVEKSKNFFVEGAWDDEFDNPTFDKSVVFMGSGGIVSDDKVTLVTPCNTLEAIYSIRTDDTYFFSNSISFLLEVTGEDLDLSYAHYEHDILTISDGIYDYKRHIPLENGKEMELHYFENIEVDANLNIERKTKNNPPSFKNFNEYYSFLIKKLKEINRNFTSDQRIKRYDPIVFVSNGYDSPMCATLGREIGCNKAVVFESKKNRVDSGKPIVELLGYENIIEKEELNYLDMTNTEEFVANGELGTSLYFSVVEDELEGTFVLSGGHGDWVWDKNVKPNTKILRHFFPGTARKEFRLRAGFNLVVIPFFAVQSHKDIHAISNSEEMKPWSLGNDYDRPIPRRIVEEKGIPRDYFGVEKDGGVASSLRFLNLTYLKRIMPAANFKEFEIFYKRNKKFRKKNIDYIIHSLKYSIYIMKIILKQKGIISSFKEPERKYACSPWAPSFLFHWGVDKVRRRYRLALNEKENKI